MTKFEEFRETYREFIYESYEATFEEGKCKVTYHYNIPELARLKTRWEFPSARKESDEILDRFLFSLGLVEAISYYKCVCPKVVRIRCGGLSQGQQAWWKKLYYNGLGEFQFLNGIGISMEELFSFDCPTVEEHRLHDKAEYRGVIVPIGGGKDSVVSLELLKDMGIYTYSVNESSTIRNVIDRCREARGNFGVKRILDKQILELNQRGFLNGHIPFSAVVAFSTVICAYLNQIKYIALSNESSANESTVKGSFVNHQYSKSYEFERDFGEYIENLCDSDIHYFSMLRPLAEIQIAGLFARYRQYHDVFRSCNAGSKQGVWCCNCSKCLFVYIVLSPFLTDEELVGIFGENLLNKDSLDRYFRELAGIDENKPFECVGTRREVCAAMKRFLVRGRESLLTRRYQEFFDKVPDELDAMLRHLETEHRVPEELMHYLREALEYETM